VKQNQKQKPGTTNSINRYHRYSWYYTAAQIKWLYTLHRL